MPVIAGFFVLWIIISSALFHPILFSGMPINPSNWICTKSKITQETLPKKEECIQWGKDESK